MLPNSSNGLTITQYSNLSTTFQINGTTFTSGTIVNPGTATLVPTAGGVLGAVGRGYELGARWEAQRWKLRTGGKVFFVCPDRHAVLVAGDGAQGLFDVDRAYDAYECAHEQTSTQLEHWDDATAAWPR